MPKKKPPEFDTSERALCIVLKDLRERSHADNAMRTSGWAIAVIEALRSTRTSLARAEASLEGTPFIDVVFDRMPDKDGARFIEVETKHGNSVSVGQWLERGDGCAVLRIAVKDIAENA